MFGTKKLINKRTPYHGEAWGWQHQSLWLLFFKARTGALIKRDGIMNCNKYRSILVQNIQAPASIEGKKVSLVSMTMSQSIHLNQQSYGLTKGR